MCGYLNGALTNRKSLVLPKEKFQKRSGTLKPMKIICVSFFCTHTENKLIAPFSIVPPDTEKTSYHKPGFFGKFVELNKVMWRTNQGLTSTHPYDSRPEVRKNIKSM
jgi:dolichyl-phosphate-mannose-protein mannosyltransferase